MECSGERRLARFLSLNLTVLPFTAEDARVAAQVRAELDARKQSIGPFDTLIAGQAMTRGLVLVTANVRERKRMVPERWRIMWGGVAGEEEPERRLAEMRLSKSAAEVSVMGL